MPARESAAMQRGVLLPMLRARFAARLSARLGADDGLTLVECIAALAVFAVFMSGLAAALFSFSHTFVKTRGRMAAVTLAQQYVEKARSYSSSNLAVNDPGDGSVPSTFSLNGVSRNVVKTLSCGTACLTYTTLVTTNGVTYTVRQLVLQGTVGTVESGVAMNEKYVVVQVRYGVPGGPPQPPLTSACNIAGCVEVDTQLNNTGVLTATPPQGIHIDVLDSATNDPINDDTINWDVSICTDNNVPCTNPVITAGSTTDEGYYENQTIAPGTYYCTVSTNDTSPSYYTGTLQDSVTQICTVTANNLTTVSTYWTPGAACPSVTTKGSLRVFVHDQNDNPVSGAPVQLQNATTGALPSKVNTNSLGIATFNNNLPGDAYFMSVSGLGAYQNTGQQGPVCVYTAKTAQGDITLTPNPTGDVMQVTVKITNNDVNKAYTLVVSDSTGGNVQQTMFVAKSKNATATFDAMPVGTGYTVTICIMQGTNCNQMQAWLNQSFTSKGHTYAFTYTDALGGL